MLYKKLLLFFLLITLTIKAFPVTFVVTSNADSGPGTLRDALTQAAANGTSETDYINFNLPGSTETDFTITLLSQLPFLSSNLVIDGTTQTGNQLGVSDAKIEIQPSSTSSPFGAFVCVDVNAIEIYGLYIRDFRGSTFNNGFNQLGIPATAMYIETSDNIQIGAPGKGNVFANDSYTVYTNYTSIKDGTTETAYGVNNLKFYSNFVGVEPDGKTARGTIVFGVDVTFCKGTVEIGGADVARRNVFGPVYTAFSGYYTGRDRLFNTSFLIENNYFCYDVNGIPIQIPTGGAESLHAVFFDLSRLIFPSEYRTITYPYSFKVLNNKVQFPYSFQMSFLSGAVLFQGNSILNEPTTNQGAGSYIPGIGIYSTDSIKIGGINPGEANIIYGSQLYMLSRKSVLINHNSLYCVNYQAVWQPSTGYMEAPLVLPLININKITATSVSGTATPLSKVELFWDDDCQYCQPLTYITTLDADANGNWKYNGPIQKGVIASATLNGFTSLFTTSATSNTHSITHYSCSNGGNITVSSFINTGGYQWTNSSNQVIGTDTVINNLTPGNYTFTALNSTCSTNYNFTILDATPKINNSNITITQPSCSQITGAVSGLYLENFDVINDANTQGIYNIYTYKWIDAGGNTVGTSIDLSNVPAGTYTLEVSYKNQCTVTYGPIVLKNTTGPNINQSQAIIQPTNCGKATGSITNLGVTGTGTLTYAWLNSQQQTIGMDSVLLNQPAGTYTLKVTDNSQCGPVYSTPIQIPETNGISLDTSNVKITVASCSNNNGSIIGITIAGATQYQWANSNNTIVATTPDLQNAAPGNYTLTASNNFGCTAISKTYTIGQQAPTIFPGYPDVIYFACAGQSTGSVSVQADSLVKSERWVDSTGQTVGTGAELENVPAGTYKLYLTDKNGCESFYYSYDVLARQQLTIVEGSEQITNDQCGLNDGSITNIQITGGTPPYTYFWTDANNNTVSTSLDLLNVGPGSYTLNVNGGNCGLVSAAYTIQEQNNIIPAPSVNNVQLCSSGDALLKVNDPSSAYSYRLYSSETSVTPIDEQASGTFKIVVSTNTTYYVSQFSGDCESGRTVVQVSVGFTTANIANTFTPNGDGINDYWNITGIENYPAAIVRIFTRYGQQIFESRGYSTPFDGTYNGKPLPAGVYYFIINLNANCSLLSGSLTIIR